MGCGGGVRSMITMIRKLYGHFSIYLDISGILVWRGMARESKRIEEVGPMRYRT